MILSHVPNLATVLAPPFFAIISINHHHYSPAQRRKANMQILIIYYFCLNVLLWVAFALDKRKASRGQWRISEKWLLLCGVLGGALGGLTGIYLCRHKTRKYYFAITYIAAIIVHSCLLFIFF